MIGGDGWGHAARRLVRSRTVWMAAVILVATGAWLTVSSLATTGGPISWSSPTAIPPGSLLAESGTAYSPTGLSCHASSLCVAVTGGGDALSSGSPVAGQLWGVATIDASHTLSAISCPSASLCVAGDTAGDLLSSEDPTGAGSAWQLSKVDGNIPITSLACPSTQLCVATDENGSILTATKPTGGPAAWSSARVDAADAPILGVSCPAVSLCVAVDRFGDVLSSREPTGGVGAWDSANVDGTHGFWGGVSCPSVSLCLATDSAGNAVISTEPAGGAHAWTVSTTNGDGQLGRASCVSARLCVATQSEGRVAVSTDPADESPSWTSTSVDEPGSLLTALSCTSELCVALDTADRAMFGTSASASEDLAVSLAGAGHGTVSGSSISCPSVCGTAYPTGSAVTLSAAPATGSAFASWSGACSGNGPCVLDMTSSESVTATFVPVASRAGLLLSVSLGGLGDGRVFGGGIACPSVCTETLPPGTTVLTAVAARGSTFSGWGGAAVGCKHQAHCQLNMSATEEVKATFVKATPSLLAITGLKVRPARHLALVTFTARMPVFRVMCGLTDAKRSGGSRPRFTPCHSPASFSGLHKGTYMLVLRGFARGRSGPAASVTRRFALR